MARARMAYTWPDGEFLEVEVSVRESYPDAVAEAKAQVVALFREGISAVTAADE